MPEGMVKKWFIPLDTANVAQSLPSTTAKHPSLWLDRFVEDKHLKDQQEQRTHLEEVQKNRPWSAEEYKNILQHLEASNGKNSVPPLLLTCESRIASHLSRAGGLENANCSLHPIYGFAYLPGSGLKGVAHSYACHIYNHKNKNNDWDDIDEKENFIRCVEDVFGWSPNKMRTEKEGDFQPRSGRETARESVAHTGKVVFYDSFGTNIKGEPPQLDIDILTNHYTKYYSSLEIPGDWHNPLPVTFLTIEKGTTFRFRIAGENQDLITAAEYFLLGGLHWLGVGAKTAAGYGHFADTWDKTERMAKETERLEKRKLEEKAKHLEIMNNLNSDDWAKETAKESWETIVEYIQNKDDNFDDEKIQALIKYYFTEVAEGKKKINQYKKDKAKGNSNKIAGIIEHKCPELFEQTEEAPQMKKKKNKKKNKKKRNK